VLYIKEFREKASGNLLEDREDQRTNENSLTHELQAGFEC